jgi:hypothetical protein
MKLQRKGDYGDAAFEGRLFDQDAVVITRMSDNGLLKVEIGLGTPDSAAIGVYRTRSRYVTTRPRKSGGRWRQLLAA